MKKNVNESEKMDDDANVYANVTTDPLKDSIFCVHLTKSKEGEECKSEGQ